MKKLHNVLRYAVAKLSCIVAWFICIKDRQQHLAKTGQVTNTIRIMSIAQVVVDTLIKHGDASSAINSKIALTNHEREVKQIATLVDSTPELNAILEQQGIQYRFYFMKVSNYFTYKIEDGITEVYLSKTYT
jgi:hypothetical protein